MVAMILFIRNHAEQKRLEQVSRDATAYFSEEMIHMEMFQNPEAAAEFFNQKQILDLACVDVTKPEDIRLIRKIRECYQQSEILLVADSRISPMEYLTPEIRAASLLLRPYQEKQCREVLFRFFRSFYQSRTDTDGEDALILGNQNGKTKIPFHLIYYIEVRERKVFIRLQNQEYSRYDSLENILKKLPDSFLQCHRSFVFNTEYFDSVKLSENRIRLEHDIFVPLSRSFKSKIKEFVNGLHRV